MARNASVCENLYAPDPDIAGRGVLITFMTHTICYVFLGLVITPIVTTFLAQLSPPTGQSASRPSGDEWASGPSGDESAVDRRTCRSGAAIVSMFTGQYVVGLAYVVATFIKHKNMTYYHLRIIMGLCSINLVVLFVCAYTRKTIPGLEKRRRSERTASPPRLDVEYLFEMQFQDSVRLLHVWILAFLHLGLLVYTFFSRGKDGDFRRCFPADIETWWLTLGLTGCFYCYYFFLVLSDQKSTREDNTNPYCDYRISRWLVALATCVGFVVAQSVQLIYIMRAFRGPAGKMNSEIELGFGQVLMFFMILQLVAEFGRGLWLDLHSIHQHFSENGGSIPRSFVIFCSVLVPLLPGKLRQEILHIWYSGPKRLAHKSKKGLSSMLRKLSEWVHGLFKKPLRRTKTTKIESGQRNSSTQSLKPEKQDENSEEEMPANASGSQEATDPDEILPVHFQYPG